MTDKPVAFRNMPASSYPFTIELLVWATRKVVWRTEVTGPGALEVPGLAALHGPIGVRITLADGTVQLQEPPSSEGQDTPKSSPP